MMVIEKGVPIPAGKSMNAIKYPFGMLEVGDSFLRPIEGTYRKAYDSMKHLARYHRIKIEIRRDDAGMRVWRTA